MRNLYSRQENIDPDLEDLLALLRPTPERDPHRETRGLARFTIELEALESNHVPSTTAPPVKALTFIDMLKENYAMLTRRPALMGVLTIVVIFVFLFGGTGITASAAQASLPGDALYPLKTGLELTQANLESDLGLRSQLYIEFAQRRLEEISALIETGRFEDIPAATSEFEEYIQKALQALSELAQSDPQRAIALNAEITGLISQLTSELSSLLAQVPNPVDTGVQLTTPTGTGSDDANANGNESNGNDANSNDANGNDDNSNDANSNDTNVNDDNGNDGNTNDVNDNDDNSNDVNDNDDDNSNDANDNDDDNSNDANDNDDDDGNDTNVNDDDNGSDDDDDSRSGSGGGDDGDDGGSGSGGDDDGGSSGSGGDDGDDDSSSGSGGGNDDD